MPRVNPHQHPDLERFRLFVSYDLQTNMTNKDIFKRNQLDPSIVDCDFVVSIRFLVT